MYFRLSPFCCVRDECATNNKTNNNDRMCVTRENSSYYNLCTAASHQPLEFKANYCVEVHHRIDNGNFDRTPNEMAFEIWQPTILEPANTTIVSLCFISVSFALTLGTLYAAILHFCDNAVENCFAIVSFLEFERWQKRQNKDLEQNEMNTSEDELSVKNRYALMFVTANRIVEIQHSQCDRPFTLLTVCACKNIPQYKRNIH